ncbi:PLD nuclease N-terminal domain-containing protein [Salinactinospora qingdaonensis]|uniref:Cardiolipin synthase N-terminal domain-containing protein n=1 Tax=Salinactinospora qingdaonensis TaxID=702744 RepID=A0ABP7FZJ7_9ACTN
MVWLGALITLVSIVLWVYAFFDALTSPAEHVRHLPKVLWLLIIVVFMLVGALLWLFLGRPAAVERGGEVTTDTPVLEDPPSAMSMDDLDPSDFEGPTSGSGPVGPDDDPEFLRQLNRRINPED